MKQLMLMVGFFGLFSAAALGLAPVNEQMLDRYSDVAEILARELPRIHLTHNRWDDALAESALDIFLGNLDYDRSFFLASDVEGFRKQIPNLDNQLRAGDLTFPFKVYGVFMERVSNRVAYVNTLLDNGFDVEARESFVWKRKDAPWPAGVAEWNELWRKKIKNQYVARLVARRLADEEKEKQAAAAVATNAIPGEAAAATNAAVAATNLVAVIKPLTPEEEIRKEYKQYLEVLNDNDADWLLTLYLTSFTRAYDPHSEYMSANNTEDFDISMRLSLFGIGALLGVEDGAAKIVRIIPGGPAEKDGRLKAGDKIIAVAQGDDEPVDILHWPLSKSVRLIRGAKGTKVVLTVIPAADISGANTIKVDLIRDEVKLEDQAAKGTVRKVTGSDGVERTLGVITVPEFYADLKGKSAGTAEPRSVTRDVARILTELKTNRLDGVVLDLRNNGGGALTEAVELTGLFINRGPVVQVKSGGNLQVLRDADPTNLYTGPLVVLVNRQSASAAEILAAALQDLGRAVLVGDTKTHGKGTVQSVVGLDPDDPRMGSLKLTTANFHRIAGGSTQLAGVAPDIVLPSILEYMEIGEEYLPHALAWTMVAPVYYLNETNCQPYVPRLKEQSEKRRREDSRFQTYTKLLDLLGERKQASEIPLNLEERIQLAKDEKRLGDMIQENQADETVETPAKPDRPDLILQETLQILCDLIVLQGEHVAANQDQPVAPVRATP